MRILTITPSLSLGGTERGAQNFSIGYKRKGHDVVVLNHGQDGMRRHILESAGCDVYLVHSVDHETLSDLKLGYFDVVHIHREGRKNERENALLEWVRGRTKLIVETNVFFAIDYSFGNSFIDISLHLSDVNRLHWLRRGGRGPSAVLPYPVNPEEFPLFASEEVSRFRQSQGIPTSAFVFGRIGQPIPGKWDPVIVSSFAKLAAFDRNVYLLLVGPSQDIRDQVLRLKDEVRRRVLMLYMLADPRQLGICYSAMNCFLHAARQGESFGLVLTEALLYGVPVITLSRPHRDNAQSEVVRNNCDGLVVRSRSGMLEAMQQILDDATLRKKVKMHSRNGVIERFGMEVVCSKALSIFESLIEGQSIQEYILTPEKRVDYDVEGIGCSSRFELILARFYDHPWINYCRENLLFFRRKLKSFSPPKKKLNKINASLDVAQQHKLKITILLPCLLSGGTEVATLETALALESLGYTVEVIVYFAEIDAAMLETFKAAGLVVHLLGVQRGCGTRTNLRLAVGLLRALRHGRYNVIWLQYITPTLLPLAVARLFTRNLIATVHVAASHYSPPGLRRLRWLARYWCARVVCVSHTVANGVFGPVDGAERTAGRVAVVPNALDMRLVQSATARDWGAGAGWPADVVVLGFAGRLVHIKGADVLLHAVARLHAQGLPVRLVMVGDGTERPDLEALALQLGIHINTHFAGRVPREEIYSAIKGFDVAVMPSRGGLEGFGLSALEAMAAGVPVVASRVDALQEVVLEGGAGLLCDADDFVGLADALARLVGDAALRQRMGAAGIAHVACLYDAPVYRARLADLLVGLGLPTRSAL